MIENFIVFLLVACFDSSGSEFARTTDSWIDHGLSGVNLSQEQDQVGEGVDPEPLRPTAPACTSNSKECTDQWSDYRAKRAEYDRKMDAWCARRNGLTLSCKFPF